MLDYDHRSGIVSERFGAHCGKSGPFPEARIFTSVCWRVWARQEDTLKFHITYIL